MRLIVGDCVEVMAGLDAESVDAIVTDPPYGLEFMGKEWDKLAIGRAASYSEGGKLHDPELRRGKGGAGPQYVQRPAKRCAFCGKQAWSGSPCECDDPRWVLDNSPLHTAQLWHQRWAEQALRVLKPGGHLLAFGGSRTYHRMASAVEDAGFEIRDQLMWLYGSGFPKSHNVAAAIDKANGVIGHRGAAFSYAGETEGGQDFKGNPAGGLPGYSNPDNPWDGWGTALKPAHEPIVLARKPLIGTVAANVQEFGTGGLNIDACRIEVASGDEPDERGLAEHAHERRRRHGRDADAHQGREPCI